MNETKFEIFYRLLNDDGRAPWQPAGTLDGLVWNGTMQLRITGDAAPLALPFELGNEDILILAVKEHSHDIMNTANSIIAQTLTRVDRTTGNVFVYSRSRRTVAGKQQWSEWEALNGATTAMLQDGSVTTPKLAADVREKVDNPLRPLFIAAGAEYNDSGADKTKTAPWGETVTHKAGHYYLNGLGDIAENEMLRIYSISNNYALSGNISCLYFQSNIRTNICKKGTGWSNNNNNITNASLAFYGSKFEIIMVANPFWPIDDTYCFQAGNISSMFDLCNNLKRIIGVINITNQAEGLNTAFTRCPALVSFRLKGIGNTVVLKDSPNLDKDSVLYMIQNALLKSAITISLHPDAYARFANDADIVVALEAQPFVSLVSA